MKAGSGKAVAYGLLDRLLPLEPIHQLEVSTVKKYSKALVALAGTAVTFALATFPPSTTAWQVASAVAALLTALGVRQVPNKPNA